MRRPTARALRFYRVEIVGIQSTSACRACGTRPAVSPWWGTARLYESDQFRCTCTRIGAVRRTVSGCRRQDGRPPLPAITAPLCCRRRQPPRRWRAPFLPPRMAERTPPTAAPAPTFDAADPRRRALTEDHLGVDRQTRAVGHQRLKPQADARALPELAAMIDRGDDDLRLARPTKWRCGRRRPRRARHAP